MAFKPRRVLVGTDFSPFAKVAADAACELVKAMGGEMVVAHSIPPFEGDYLFVHSVTDPFAVQLKERIRTEAQRALDGEAERIAATGVRVGLMMLSGSPAMELARVAGELAFDLIVIGTHGRTGVRRLLIGSVAEATVRHSPVSVLTVRAP